MTLTPYDTGQRAEPKPWVASTAGVTDDNEGWFGKVDFENDSSETIAVVWFERGEDGRYTLHLEPVGEDVEIEVHE